jgi:ech hydrogenase subunit E
MKQKITIPLGSQHIALLEPVRFNFTCENEKIIDVDYNVGFVHRGIEKACAEKFEFKQVGYVVARVCGLCAITHSMAYTIGVETILGAQLNKKIQYLRLLMLELDRIHSHLLCLSHTAENTGFEGMFMKIMGEREPIMDLQEAITGNRVQFDYVSIGGVNREMKSETADFGRKVLKTLDIQIDDLMDKFTNNWSSALRYKNIGTLSKDNAYKFGALGPLARAAGASIDARCEIDSLPYVEVGFEMILGNNGDIFDRNIVRLKEIKNSIKMCLNILDGLPEGEIFVKTKGKPNGESFTRLEAPRGEIFYYVNGNGKNILQRVRIKTPTFSQIPAMVEIFKGQNYADAPAILASFDPCMSCTAK